MFAQGTSLLYPFKVLLLTYRVFYFKFLWYSIPDGQMRCFIAIELPGEVKSALAGLQEEFKKYGVDVRWVKPDNIHLTLKFLGDIDEKKVEEIVKRVEKICDKYESFSLETKGVGIFPSLHSPRVLWVGIKGNSSLIRLQADMEDEMSSIGFKRENRGFTPHLTIGRFKSSVGKRELANRIELHRDDSFGLINVKAIVLMKSDLKPSGAEYTRIAEIPLKTNT
jgi:2'-5' RNA ligase